MGLRDWKRMNFKHKNNKLAFYVSGYFVMYFRTSYKSKLLEKKLKSIGKYDQKYIDQRVSYYNKLNNPFQLKQYTFLKDLKLDKNTKTYYLDFFKFVRYFPPQSKLRYEFGDITHIPQEPSVLKSRPVCQGNENSVLFNLNKIRHFLFISDNISYNQKKDMMVWRGKVKDTSMLQRAEFFSVHFKNGMCNIGAVNTNITEKTWIKPRLTIEEQLQYKFILSIEGNDVATNLKWIMSSNSIAVMTKPKYETWFMEGTLIPDFHYIQIKDDYSDLNEKLNYYIKNPDKSEEIKRNANKYVEQFKDKKREKLISLLVLKKYFEIVN